MQALEDRCEFLLAPNKNRMVVSNVFFFHPYLGKWSNLTNIFQMGWFNHQLENYATQHTWPFHQAITALGMGIALLLVARRIVLGTASVGDVPMVQGAAGGILGFGESDGFLGARFISAEKIPLNLHGDYDKQIIRIPIQQPNGK